MRENKKLVMYLIFAFAIAWVLQIFASVVYHHGNTGAYQLLLMVTMFAPFAAVILSGNKLKGMGWKPALKGKVRYLFAAWFLPALLGLLGAILYFLLVPAAFDTEFSYIVSMAGEENIAELYAQGLSLPVYAAISFISSLTYAPWVNMFAAIGEEAGWRGCLYPALKSRLGITKGRLLGGVIWGVWHWPIMILTGYEYGTDYWGAPITGMLLFCIFAVAAGILLDWLYETTECIWIPALAHGAINAFGGVPAMFLKEAYANQLLLGPLMIGCIGGLPLIAVAVLIFVKSSHSKS